MPKRITKAVGKKVELLRRTISCPEDLEAKKRNENLLKEYTFAANILGIGYQTSDEPFVFSPLAISLGLSLLHIGATGSVKSQIQSAIFKGSTHEELEQYFSEIACELSRSKNRIVFLANHLFASTGIFIEKDYLERIRILHQTGLTQLPLSNDSYGSAVCVNSQVGLKTRNHIDKIIMGGDLRKDTTLLLANALHFRAEFAFQFTYGPKRHFHSDMKSSREIEYLGDVFVPRQYSENKIFQVLVLPYTNNKFALNIFLPKKHCGLRHALTTLCPETMLDLIKDTKEERLNIRIPKFKVETRFSHLKGVLAAMGMYDVFDKTQELSGISSSKFVIAQMVHKAKFEVGENGTYSTSLKSELPRDDARVVPQAFKFTANHPFLYVVTMDLHPLYIGVYK